MASAISDQGEMVYRVSMRPFTGEAMTEFLQQLLEQWEAYLILIWDNASIHNCKATRQFLETHPHAHRLWLVQQPKYAPELNADEQVWSYLKRRMLKDRCNHNRKQLTQRVMKAMEDMKANTKLIQSFFRHPQLGYITQ